jgi:stage V sporulation protein SpoVS
VPPHSKGQGQESELTVATSTSITALAGAIAGKVRDNVAHCVTAMGDVSVATAVYAIALAREVRRSSLPPAGRFT